MSVTPASTTFVDRHIGARRQADVDTMLKDVRTALDKLDKASLKDLNSMEDPFTKANDEAKKLGLDSCAN